MPDTTRDTNDEPAKVLVQCTECPFEQLVRPSEADPAEVIIEHGRETDHTLTISRPDA